MNEEFYFFWNGPFSQWYPSKFTVTEGITFFCAEQYMMYCKALLFKDDDSAKKILKAKIPRECKKLGREVKGFIKNVWEKEAKVIVYKGNYLKFVQNKDLLEKLLNTKGLTLVEASPYDKIWGIGLSEKEAIKTPKDQWKGTNWLGEVLTKLRDDLLYSKSLGNF